MICVWIAYDPQVLREALVHFLSKLENVEVVENASDKVDVGIFRLSDTGKLQDFFLHKSLPQSKLIVFSPRGDQAYIRSPGENIWKKVCPFGIAELVNEIRAGRGKCVMDLNNQTVTP